MQGNRDRCGAAGTDSVTQERAASLGRGKKLAHTDTGEFSEATGKLHREPRVP